jgi:hypothetical protein
VLRFFYKPNTDIACLSAVNTNVVFISCSVVSTEESVMACASPSIQFSFKFRAKALGKNYLPGSGCFKSVVSYPFSKTFGGLPSPIRVDHRDYDSNHAVRAFKTMDLNMAASSTNGNLKVPGKLLVQLVLVTESNLI